jgi:hypothetical protein
MNFKFKLIILFVILIALSYVQSFPDSLDDQSKSLQEQFNRVQDSHITQWRDSVEKSRDDFDRSWKESHDRQRDFSRDFDEHWKESLGRHNKAQSVFFIVFFIILGIILIVFVGIITFSILVCLGVVNAPRCKFLKNICTSNISHRIIFSDFPFYRNRQPVICMYKIMI